MIDEQAELEIVGHGVARLDAVRKVTGAATYVNNMRVVGMLYGKLVRSPYPHALIRSIDTSQAEELPGVRAVITGATVTTGLWGSQIKDQPTLPRDRVRFAGEPVAAVAADTEEIAARAAQLVEVEYEELPFVDDVDNALKPGAPLVHEAAGTYEHRDQVCRPVDGTNILNHTRVRKGDLETGFAQVDVVVERTYTTHAQAHVSLEPHASLAQWDADGRLTVWTGTQAPFLARNDLARALCLPPSRVRIIAPDVGGGFGGKVHIRLEAYCALLARAAKRPVRMVHTRYEEFIGTTTRHPSTIHLRVGARKDGTLVAAEVTVRFNTGAYSDSGEVVSWQAALGAAGPYRVPNLSVDTYSVYTHRQPAGAYRGMGWPQTTWAFESNMDCLARVLGMDPLEIRLKNVYRDGDLAATGQKLETVALAECLQRVAQAVDWGSPLLPNHGRGIACVTKTSAPFSAASATVKLNEDGYAHLIAGAVEIGTGSHTTLAQICAEALGLPLDRVIVSVPDTDYSPYDGGAISDRTTPHLGAAVRSAALDARQQILDAAGEMLEVAPEDLCVSRGAVYPVGQPSKTLSFAQVVAFCQSRKGGPILGAGRHQEEGIIPLDPETGQSPRGTSHYKFGAQAVEVEVDPETGRLTVLKVASAHDCGKAINPVQATGQVEGAVAQGLGYALLEEMHVEDGRVTNASLMEYAVPTTCDVPPIEPLIVEHAHAEGPFGAKGVGEPGIIGIAAAVGNALEDAMGVRVYDLPITYEKVLAALDDPARQSHGDLI